MEKTKSVKICAATKILIKFDRNMFGFFIYSKRLMVSGLMPTGTLKLHSFSHLLLLGKLNYCPQKLQVRTVVSVLGGFNSWRKSNIMICNSGLFMGHFEMPLLMIQKEKLMMPVKSSYGP